VVDATLKAFGFDIGYRIAPSRPDLTTPGRRWRCMSTPTAMVWDRDGGDDPGGAGLITGPVAPTIGFRIEHGGASVVLAGDTVPL